MANSFGNIFTFSTFGESHGKAIGCIVDGVPPLIPLTEDDIQPYLDKRRPGQNRYTTQRQEQDQVEILSGTFEGKTTGTPIALIIHNQDQRSKDYGEIKDKFRPGHADYVYQQKYQIRDYRGGGRSSARETAMRVAAGAIARKIIAQAGIKVTGYLSKIGKYSINPNNIDYSEINNNDFFSPDTDIVPIWADYIDNIRKNGSSIGAVIELVAENIPVGLGAPIYDKLDADIAKALMSINAVKAVEIGDGFAAAELEGTENADEMQIDENGQVTFNANHAGGILGGISTGQPIIARFAIKPTSSILTEVNTIDIHSNNTTIRTKGRHDPCVGIRAVPVGEAMLAIVLADHYLMHLATKPLIDKD